VDWEAARHQDGRRVGDSCYWGRKTKAPGDRDRMSDDMNRIRQMYEISRQLGVGRWSLGEQTEGRWPTRDVRERLGLPTPGRIILR